MKHEEGDHVTISLEGHANDGHVGVVHQISPSGQHYGVKNPKTNEHIGYFHSSNLKSHGEELDESTELMEAADLDDGVELRPKKSPHNIYHNGESKPAKAYDVHLHGEHIGHVVQTVFTGHKKIPGSRLVKPMAPKLVWSKEHNRETVDKYGVRRDINLQAYYPHSNAKEAANSMAKHYQGKPMSNIQEALRQLRESRNESVEGRTTYSDKAHEAGMAAHKSSVGASNRQQHQAAAKLHGTASGLHGLAAKEYPISDERHAHHYMNAAVHLKASLHHSTAAIGKGTVNESVNDAERSTFKGHPSAIAHKESAKANDQTSICHADSPPSAHERAAELHKAASAAHIKAISANTSPKHVHLLLSRHHDAMTAHHNAAAISATWK